MSLPLNPPVQYQHYIPSPESFSTYETHNLAGLRSPGISAPPVRQVPCYPTMHRGQGYTPFELNTLNRVAVPPPSYPTVLDLQKFYRDDDSIAPPPPYGHLPGHQYCDIPTQRLPTVYNSKDVYNQQRQPHISDGIGISGMTPYCGYTERVSAKVNRELLPMRDIGHLKLEYFKIGRFFGRGGKVRLFLMAKHIKHEFVEHDISSDFVTRQQELIQSGASPTGQLPIIHHSNHIFCESHSILRYLAKRIGEYGSFALDDYQADMIVRKGR